MSAIMQTDAWAYFKASENSLRELQDLLHDVSVYAAKGAPLPMEIVRRFDQHAGAFRHTFLQMRHSLQIAAMCGLGSKGGPE